jgi:hypothetical protein
VTQLIITFLFFLLQSCSSRHGISQRDFRNDYSYHDGSGKFVFQRETKFSKNTIVTRQKISSLKSHKILEKSIVASKLGSVGVNSARVIALMPLGSDFEVWLDGNRYSSKLRTDTKNKKMILETNGLKENEKWYGTTAIQFPKSKFFCFFSQIPDCLYQIGFLQSLVDRPEQVRQFYSIWDSFPFSQDQYSGMGKNLFSSSSVKFDREEKNIFIFEVDIEGQLLLYYFSKSYDLVKIVWIAQGIMILPPGEEPNQND